MVLRQVGPDFEAQYGYRPWLVESFVDTEHFLGTCYKATNWIDIGKTQGRGRQDRENKKAKSVKTIYVYAIEPQWRARMGVAEPVGLVPLEIGRGSARDALNQGGLMAGTERDLANVGGISAASGQVGVRRGGIASR